MKTQSRHIHHLSHVFAVTDMIKILLSAVNRHHQELKSQTDVVGLNSRVTSYLRLQ